MEPIRKRHGKRLLLTHFHVWMASLLLNLTSASGEAKEHYIGFDSEKAGGKSTEIFNTTTRAVLYLTDIAELIPVNLALNPEIVIANVSQPEAFTATLLFSETFDEAENATVGTDNTGGVSWTALAPGAVASTDYLKVVGGVLEARDTNSPAANWTTGTINTTGFTNIGFSMDLSEDGTMEECADCSGTGTICIDWVKLEYRIDGGAWQEVAEDNCDVSMTEAPGSMIQIGDISGETESYATTISSGIGNTIEWRISCVSWTSTEYWRFDNIQVNGSSGTIPEVDLSVSASTGTEADGTVITVTATASAAVSGDQTVNLGVSGTNVTSTDYALSNSTITILNGQTTGSVTFTIQDDADSEGTETATLTISNPSFGLTLGTATSQNVTITDNESAPPTSLSSTAQTPNNGQRGVMFDLVATNVITINSFEHILYDGLTADYEIYYRPGTFVGFEENAAAWTLLGGPISLTGTTGQIAIPIPINVTIPAGQSYGFYITNTSGGGTNYTQDTGDYELLGSDANLAIRGGVGKSYPFSLTFPGRWTNVIVHYSLGAPSNPEVDLSVSTGTGTETDQTVVTVTATASTAVNGNQTVDLGVSGTGITGTDYALSNTSITILDGATTGTVTFTIQDDADVENAETATLTISNPSSGVSLGTTTAQDVSITDNDFPTVDLSVSASAGTEAAQTVITVTATTSAAVSGDQTVDLGVSGTGITGADYILSNTTITILNGQTTGSVTFTIQDDAAIEGTETASLTISNPSAGLTLGTTSSQDIAITDNDTPTVDLSVSASAGTEVAQTIITVTATASAAVSGDQTVDLGVSGTNVTGTDYALSNSTITILNGQTTGSVTFTIQDDADSEGTETATLAISNPSSGLALGTNTSEDVVITDDDTSSLSCGLTNQTCLGSVDSQVIGDESEGLISSATMHFGEATSGDRRGRVQFLYTAAELNAAGFTAPGKISSLWFKYVFASNPANTVTNLTMKMGCTSLTSLGEGAPTETIPEDRWDFETGLTQVATYASVAPPAAFMFPPSFAWVEFPINEPGMDGFLWDGVSNILVEFCTPDLQTDKPFFMASSATGSDTRALYLYDFATGAADGCSYTAGVKSTTRPIVRMDICSLFPEVNLSVSANTGTEADQTVITVTATADAAVSGDQTIDLGVSGTGIAGTDYSLSNTTITILNGATPGSVTFTIQDDADIEGTETATLTMSNASSGLTLGATTSQDVSITDNDFPTVDLSVSANIGNEVDGTVITVTATASAAVTGNQTVDLGVSGTGITGADYSLSNSTITILNGQTTGSVTFTVQSDAVNEIAEVATLTISNPSSGLVLGSNTSINITITDEDCSVSSVYTRGTAQGQNSGSSPYWVTIIGNRSNRQQYIVTAAELNEIGMTGAGLITAFDLNFVNANTVPVDGLVMKMGTTTQDFYTAGTTTANVEPYITGLTTVIEAGNIPNTATVGWQTFTLANPFLWDGSSNIVIEFVTDSFNSPGTPANINYELTDNTMAMNAQSTGTVGTALTTGQATNQRPIMRFTLCAAPTVDLSVSTNSGTEADGTVITVTATASTGVSGNQTVDLGISGTGITGTDYALSNTTITILDGATTGTVTFTIQDDTDIEGDETATLTISNPLAGVTLGTTTTQNVTITDNDFPSVELSVSANAGTEADQTVITVTATASQAVDGNQTVDLGVSGTSITGTDYALSNATITILDGATTGMVTFTIQDDADIEGNETATLTISNPSAGVTLGATTTQNVTITDNDFPTVELSVSANTGTEADQTVITVTATASQAVDGNQTVDLGVSGTGIANTDYTLSNTTITILDGATTGMVTFTIQDDADIEGDETATLTISSPSTGVTLGTTTTQNVTITDNDFPTVELSVSENAGTEADQTVITVTATASQAVDGNQTVDLGVSGTGIANTDYSLSNATITILDGATTGTVTFTIQDDADIEGDETATLTISNPSAGLTLGTTSTQNIAITDNDFPTIELSVSANTGTEADQTVITVTATASQTVDGNQTVDLGVSGTGIANTDYTLSNATITILDGATTGTVTFTVQDDVDIEGAETATLTISNPSAGLTSGTTTTQNVTITDNDFPSVELSVSANAGTEAAQTVITVTATASQAVDGNQTVDLGVSGTGIASTDYSLSNATITILDGATTGTVTFTIQDDADIEGDETATLTISNPSAGVTLGTTTTQNVTIMDNDFPSVELSVSANAGTEAAQTVITVTATASQAVDGNQTVDLGVSGTGIANTDYTLSNATITILDGASTSMVTFTIQDDADIEGDETATLTISNPSAGVTLGTTTIQNVTITDNDFPTVELSVSANAGTEADQTVITVTATASQAVDGDQTVDLGVSGTGIANTDYILSSATITMLDGATTGMVTFTIQDDADIEGDETATLTISSPSTGVTLGTTTTQNVTITDNDFPTVELSVSANAGTEADQTVITVTATTSQAVDGDQTVDLGVSGTGITGTDYTLSNATMTILDGATTGMVTFTVQDDAAIEGDETATLTISNPSVGLTLGATTAQNIAITDNDFPTVELSVSANAGTEADQTVITVTATTSQAVDGDQTVDLGVSGTGITGTDYTLSNATMTILDGATTGMVTFTVQDDAAIEGDETATLTISNPSVGLTLGATTAQNIAITDNDFPTVELSVSANAGTEADQTVITVTATVSQAVDGDQTVDLGISGTGIANTDYTLSNATITILDGATTGMVTFTIQDDADIEGDETAMLAISNPSAGLILGTTTTQNIVITDNDMAGFTLTESGGNTVVQESGTTDDFTVILDAQPTVNVTFAVSSDDATEASISPLSLTFTPANWNVPQTVTITGVDDAVNDGDVMSNITVDPSSGDADFDVLANQTITVTTLDDEGPITPTVELSASANTGTEADQTVITVTATASQAVDGDQTVDLGVSGTGIANTDYTLSNATITILDGATTGMVTFTIQDDADIEGDETATLTINNASAGLTLGATTTQNIAITDNDFPTVELSVSSNAGTETAQTVITVTATASQAVDGNQTVDLGVGGTGITNTDYALSNATLTILDGATTGTVTFTVQDDANIEGDETATLTISNPSAGVTLGTTTTQNVTITDNDFPTVELSVSANTGTEAAQTVITVTATASQAVTGDQTVDLGISGTGIANTDYTLSNATITILDGATTGMVTFTIQDDADIEGDETATLTISNPSAGVTLGTTTIQNVTITDNDFPTVELSVSANAGTEAAQTVITVTATASQAVDGAQTVDLGVSGTGIANTDYTLSNATITILDGATTGMVTFTIQDDADIEGDETAMLAISNPSASLTLGATTAQNIAITDNDFPTVELSVSANAGTEVAQTVITVTATASQAVDGNQTVDLGVSGTGIANTDYILSNGTITILDGATTGMVTFTIQDDADIEGDETATLTISNPSAGVTLGTTTIQNVTITDNDMAGFTLTESGGNTIVQESGTMDDFTVVLDAQPTANVTFAVSSDDATEASVSPLSLTFTPANWNVPQTVTITGVDDAVNDGDVMSNITVDPSSGDADFDVLANQTITVTTLDDEGPITPTVELSASANTGTEADQTVITVTATASQAVDGDQTVDLGVSGTGIANADYTLSNATVTILDGATTGMVTFTVQDDAAIEGDETATLTISNPSAGLILGTTTAQNVVITDNDMAGFTLTESGGNTIVQESGTMDDFTVVLDAQPTANVTFAVSSDDATEASVSPLSLTFTPANWNVPQTVTITGVDDAVNDGDVMSNITVDPSSGDADFDVLANQTITVTTLDDEGPITPTVELSASANTGTEADQTVITVTATASQAVDGDQTVDLGVSGTGVANTDYTLSNATVTILDGATTGTVTFTIQDDAAIEGDEAATLTISNPSAGLILGTTTAQNVVITDNDMAGFTLTESGGNTVVQESGTTDDFTVVLDAQPTVNVTFAISSDDATEASVSPSNLTFTPANWNVPQTVTITGVDDAVNDGDIMSSITVDPSSGDADFDALANQTITVTTLDDEGPITPTAELSVSANTGTEAAQTVITVTATASQAVTGDQTVDLGVNGTGITNMDYILSNATITILNGQTTGSITLTIQDDADIEGDETATLSISNPSAGLTFGTTTTQNVAIIDNDFPTVELSVSSSAGTETAQTVITVTATASQAVDGDQTVNLGISGTGIANTDYTLSNATITILDGATIGMVTFTIQDDTDIEGDETAILTISNPSAGLILGATTAQNIVITDNDMAGFTLTESGGNTVVQESSTTDDFTVVLDEQPTVNVTFAISSDDATEASVSPVSLTFTPANWNVPQTVTITGVDDAVNDGDVMSNITVDPSSGDADFDVLANQTITVTTLDDEGPITPTVELSVSANTGIEAGQTVITVTATASQAVDGDQTIDLGVSGTGIANTDYSLSNSTITILDGATTGMVTFTIQDDTDIEGDETATLTISNPSTGLILGTTTTQNISITDNDFPSVELSVSANAGTEAAQTVITVTATASQAVDGDQTIDLGVSGTGIANTDYILSNGTITILDGATSGMVTFTIQDDADIEGDETATLAISNPSAGLILGTTTTQNIVITDNDMAGFTLTESGGNTVVQESGTTDDFTVVLDAQPTVNVTFAISSDDATEASVSPLSLTFTPANWNVPQTVTITGVDDAVNDGDVMSNITVDPSSGDADFDVLANQTITVTTLDDEGVVTPTVELSVSAHTGTEAAQTVITVTATASQAVDGDQTVDLGVSGTGIANTDYTLSNATITILDGATTGMVTFTIQDDVDIEGNETATLAISNPSAGVTLGTTTTQNVTITDNDFPTVELSVSASAGTEAAQTVITVTATASQAVDGDQTVDLGVSGTGITNTDYTLSNATITILDGATTGMVTFTIQDDAAVEGDETATLSISNPSAGLILGTTTTQNISITDNDFPSVELSVSANAGTEAAQTVITVTATASQAVDGDQTIDLGVSGTGIANTDYILSNGTITILDGATSGMVTFTIQDDADIEGDETATLAISNPSAGLILGTTTAQNVVITDNDMAGFTLTESGGNTVVQESGTTDDFTVVLDAQPTVNVTFAISSDDATEASVSPSNLTFTPANWNVPQTVTITGVDDAVNDGDVMSNITVDPSSGDADFDALTNQTITVTTLDDEGPITPTVELSVSANTGTEAAQTVITVTATASQAVTGDQTVDLGVNGTGITNTDYILSNATITILNGQTTGSITLTIQDDADIEGDETARLTISNPSAGLILGTTTTQNISITDNDFPSVELSVSANAGTEAAQTVITVTATASQAVDGDQTIDLGVSGTGIANTDYILSNGTITILDGATSGMVTFTIQDDADIEGDETATLAISNPSAGLILGTTTTQNIVITDNDMAGFTLTESGGNTVVQESGTTDDFTVVLDAQPTVNVTFAISSDDATEASVSPSNLTFTPANWNVPQTVTITGVDDAVNDGDVMSNITVDPSSGDADFDVLANQTITVTTLDDEGVVTPTVELSVSAHTGTEAAQTVITVTATASQAVDGDQTVDLGVSGTGIANTDYTLSNATITILDGATTGMVTFTIQDDVDIEGNETATLAISNPSAGVTLGTTTTQNVTITDNDFPTVELSVSANTGTEAAQTVITVTATASQAVDGDQTVDLGVSGTGITNTDYSLSNTTITILDGATTGMVTFTIQDDADIEGDETATLTISNPSVGVTLGTTTIQNVTITDNDFPTVELSVSASAGTEAAQTVITVTATASQAVDGDQTVDLGVSGTGIVNTDYTLSNATITILNGQTTGSVTFTIQDDADIEGDETATLTISNPSAGLASGTTIAQNITITDNDFPTVELSVSANVGTESDQTIITITATTSQAVDGNQTVDLGVSGTGIANTDYTLSNATITILDGATTGMVTFTIQDDADIEGDETATLTISNPSAGLTLGATATQSIAIIDNDEVEPDLINTTITASPLSLVADGVTASVITVQLIDSDGNALMTSRGVVTLNVTGNALLTAVSDNGDGTYTAMLTNTVAEMVTVTGQWDGLNISTEVEVEFTPDNTDTDGDGVYDRLEDLNDNGDLEDDDTDRDGIPNYLDTDDDGDSILTRNEDIDGDGDPQNDDTDEDQIPNYLDEDDDNDGVLTIEEDANGNLDLFDDDTDGDEIPNFLDPVENMVVDKLFSPNGDGINDVLQIRDAEKFPNNKVSIFNRQGNLIFEIEGYDNRGRGWNGIPNKGLLTSGDKIVPNGTYFYVIEPNDGSETITGFFILKR